VAGGQVGVVNFPSKTDWAIKDFIEEVNRPLHFGSRHGVAVDRGLDIRVVDAVEERYALLLGERAAQQLHRENESPLSDLRRGVIKREAKDAVEEARWRMVGWVRNTAGPDAARLASDMTAGEENSAGADVLDALVGMGLIDGWPDEPWAPR
jgi:hypothetical protein